MHHSYCHKVNLNEGSHIRLVGFTPLPFAFSSIGSTFTEGLHRHDPVWTLYYMFIPSCPKTQSFEGQKTCTRADQIGCTSCNAALAQRILGSTENYLISFFHISSSGEGGNTLFCNNYISFFSMHIGEKEEDEKKRTLLANIVSVVRPLLQEQPPKADLSGRNCKINIKMRSLI